MVTVPAGVANVQNTWAPEWFKDSDGSVNLIVSIDTTNAAADFRPYKFTATDGTLTKWSGPTPIGIEPNYIDTFVVKLGSTYHAIAKNETSKFIEHATAPSLTGPWKWVGTGDWAGWGSGKEGPALFQLDGGQWRLFLDCYSGCGYLTSTTPAPVAPAISPPGRRRPRSRAASPAWFATAPSCGKTTPSSTAASLTAAGRTAAPPTPARRTAARRWRWHGGQRGRRWRGRQRRCGGQGR